MHREPIIPDDCARAREQASSRLDSELSEFEHVSLEAHLQRCGDCQAVAASLAAVTEILRSAPVEAPSLPCWVPRRTRSRRYARRGISVATAAAIVAVSGLVGLQLAGSPTQGPDAHTRELMGLKERQMDQLVRADRPLRAQRGVTAAEGTALGGATNGERPRARVTNRRALGG